MSEADDDGSGEPEVETADSVAESSGSLSIPQATGPSATWRPGCLDALAPLHARHACKSFLDGWPMLGLVGGRIPQMSEVSTRRVGEHPPLVVAAYGEQVVGGQQGAARVDGASAVDPVADWSTRRAACPEGQVRTASRTSAAWRSPIAAKRVNGRECGIAGH